MLKPPVWTWEIPTYFFVGGVAGVAAVIAGAGGLAGADAVVVRDARWIAAAGALLSPALLISDLGRPARFLNMLRVLKPQSAMSVGVWALVAFSGVVLAAVALTWVAPRDVNASMATTMMHVVLDIGAIATGLLLTTYTGVLLGVTAIPVWARHAAILPLHFGASSLGAGASAIELLGSGAPALHGIALAAAVVETIVMLVLSFRRRGSEPEPTVPGARLIRIGEWLAGPLALGLRIAAPLFPLARAAAGVAALAGSLVSRFGWVAVGRAV